MSQVTLAPSKISVAPDVPGNIFNGNYAFAVNTNNGTIIYNQAPEPVTLRAISPRPPSQPPNFVDRVGERAQLDESIRENAAIVVYGQDGTGKSTLLRAAARSDAARALPEGVVRLEGIDAEGQLLRPGDIVQRLFDALYASNPPLKVDAALARTYLSITRPLVILDNVSLPTRDSLQTLIDLFPDSPIWFALNQMPLSATTAALRLGVLPHEVAIELFAKQAGLIADDTNRVTLDELCARLADVPLAIVIAANVIRDRSVDLDRARQILAAAQPPSSNAVQAGIERAYALAYLTLSKEERQTLAAVAAAPGVSVAPEGVRAMLNAAAWVDPAIERLKAAGLLHANSPRLRLDPGLRSIALANVNVALLRERLMVYLQGALQTQSLDWTFCADELGNILGLLEWAAQQNRWADVIVLGRAIDPYLTLHGLWEAWRLVLNRILDAARSIGDRAIEGWARHQLGTHAAGVGQTSQALRFLRQALELRRTLGDETGMAFTQHNLDILLPPVLPINDKGGPPPIGRSIIVLGSGIMVLIMFILAALASQPNPSTAATPTVPNPTAQPTLTRTIAPSPSVTASATATATRTATSTPTATSTSTPTAKPTFTPSPTPCGPPWGYVTYIVQPGDTWYGLAVRIGAPADQLLFANCATLSTMLYTGQSISVPHLPPPIVTSVPTITAWPPLSIASAEALPAASYYGAVYTRKQLIGCGDSTVAFNVVVQSAVGQAQVDISYAYQSAGVAGGWNTVTASDQGNGLYQAIIDNNTGGAQVLNGLSGEIRWHASAVDARGARVTSGDYFAKVQYCGSSLTDLPTLAPTLMPIETPTESPTATPTDIPTFLPTELPTATP